MKVGIVGFAGAGKTTVFNALTGLAADTGLGAKSKHNLGMIKVPDHRVDYLAQIYNPRKTVYAEIAFVDVPGPNAESGRAEAGLAQSLVNEMRQADALVNVIRGFDNPALTRAPDPLRDFTDFESELVISDLIQVEARLQRIAKEGNKNTREKALMERLRAQLDAGMPLRGIELSEPERQAASGFAFLSLKPCMAVVNQPDEAANCEPNSELLGAAAERGVPILSMAARAEAEIAELAPDDQAAFLVDLGLSAPARDRFVSATFQQLDLISFLTDGEDECRAWPIKRGTVARAAAGKVHSDIERGFIRAEVVAFADFQQHGSEAQCRAAGKLRLEGKDYVVQDGDIIHFRFNV